MKVCGQGLSIELKSFDVSLIPGQEAKILRGDDCRGWSLVSFRPNHSRAAAMPTQESTIQIAKTATI